MAQCAHSIRSLVVKELRVRNELVGYDIDIEKTLGQGGFGKVLPARRKTDNKLVALKFFGYTRKDPNMVFINNEIMLMTALLGLSGVIQLESIMYDSEDGFIPNKVHRNMYPIIAMEMVGGGDFFDRMTSKIRKDGFITEKFVAKMFHNAALSVQQLHNRGYIHRDLKLDNLLLCDDTNDSKVKIIDFGFLCHLPGGVDSIVRTNQLCGTHGYMAPESLNIYLGSCNEFSIKSDVWQMGCILYCLLCGHPPFHLNDTSMSAIRAGNYCKSSSTYCGLSQEAKDLLRRMFQVNPLDRIHVKDILEHTWMYKAPASSRNNGYAQRVRAAALRHRLRTAFLSSDKNELSICNDVNDSNACTMAMIDEDETAAARRFFECFDENKDHMISRKELCNGVAKLLLGSEKVTELCPILRRDIDEVFDIMDENKDGFIDFAEFVAFYGEAALTSQTAQDSSSGLHDCEKQDEKRKKITP